MFLIAKRAEKDDFSQKSDEDGLKVDPGLTRKILGTKTLDFTLRL